eukprot:7616882-Pyramimonas_sp.AAC.1
MSSTSVLTRPRAPGSNAAGGPRGGALASAAVADPRAAPLHPALSHEGGRRTSGAGSGCSTVGAGPARSSAAGLPPPRETLAPFGSCFPTALEESRVRPTIVPASILLSLRGLAFARKEDLSRGLPVFSPLLLLCAIPSHVDSSLI